MIDEFNETFETLKVLSESISASTKGVLRDENVQAMKRIADSFRSITLPPDNASKMLNEITRLYRIPQLPEFIPQKSFTDLLSKQLSTFAFSELYGTSALVDSFKSALINTDYSACVSAISKALSSSTISTVDFSFLKTIDISQSFSSEIVVPTGLRTALKDLNMGAAKRLAKKDDITYDFEKSAFVVEDTPAAIATAKEMNVISSGAELFDCLEEEYISEPELMNFMTFLQNSPTFASENAVGKKIQKLIENIAEHISFDCAQYYHSRARELDAIPFTYDEMLTAPSGVTGPGRYNHPGQAFYYFADTVEGSAAEVKKHNKGKQIQTAVIRPNKKINMVDLSGTIKNGQTFLKYIRFEAKGENMPKAYLIPCFVSDCCRACNIDGIKYFGSKAYSNYVCWNTGYFEFVSML